MRLQTHIAVLALILAPLLGSCATQKQASDKTAAPSSTTEASDDEVSLMEEVPSVKKLDSSNGVSSWKVGGLKVIHKPTPANSVISAKLFIDGGVAAFSDEQAGLEQLTLRTAVNGGSKSTPDDAFSSALDSMGSSVSYFTSRDFSGYELRCVLKHFDSSWNLFTEAILEPALPKQQLEVQRQAQLAEIAKIQENPNQLVGHTARQLITKGHPYQRLQMGTAENVRGFNVEDLRAYHADLMQAERLTLVVVGDIDSDALLSKVKESVGRIQSGNWNRPEIPSLTAKKPDIKGVAKSLPTNYIMGKFPTPDPGEEDYAALQIATSFLSDRLFEEVRTKRNLSYAVASGITARRASAGYLYVSAKQPNKTMQVMLNEVEKLKNEPLTDAQLKRTRNVYITEYFMGMETNASQATKLGQNELVAGDWQRTSTFLDKIRAVTAEDVQKAARTYIDNYQFGIVGDPGSIDRSVFLGAESEKEMDKTAQSSSK
jgi:zinc protease